MLVTISSPKISRLVRDWGNVKGNISSKRDGDLVDYSTNAERKDSQKDRQKDLASRGKVTLISKEII